ncbi:MAG: HD domain-containing protein [Bacteroidales bacterium]|nr:HD domain-containing protein [Bacteroidales bacterium]MCF8405997.1 HD domain-containing protein [Bacteroidales bacterium]
MYDKEFSSYFTLKEAYFDHFSQLHGIGHTYRVMMLSHFLADSFHNKYLYKMSIASAFVHDMARKHNGYCTDHGKWAADKKIPVFSELFIKAGIDECDIYWIKKAVENHSVSIEFKKNEPAFLLTALLKDADALDRIRLGESNLDKGFLRLEQSHLLISFAKEFYRQNQTVNFCSFTEVLTKAELLYLKFIRNDQTHCHAPPQRV